MKLIAVLNDRSGDRPGKPCGLSGARFWNRRIKYSTRKLAIEKASIDKA